ncbi:NirD/YgiW/YdeI family stress tolerance protein [Salinarimonas chemoclinalis]|uniref:NirD/YgiW/YdeI family stress tolerance protein n=1 Tax=Salinarimonas chemoclinalis TaxID=3241599 RepID=UPI003556CF27
MKTLATFAFAFALAIPLAASPIAAQPTEVTPTEVTPIAEAQRGTMVTVRGTVERITDEDEFRLADASGTIRVYVGPNWVPADVGEAVTVSGFVDDGLGPREIYARTLTRADGTVVAFERRYD